MSDVIDVFYRLRNMTANAADELRAEIAKAQGVLDKLDKFTLDSEESAELLAVSDLYPTWHSSIPDRAGLVFSDGRDKYGTLKEG